MNAASPEELLEARRWLGAADEELVVVDVLLTDQRSPIRVACFHAHLAVEKSLKALLIFRGIIATKTHDLAHLHRLLTPEDAHRIPVDALIVLNPWALDGRYPSNLDEPTPTEIRNLTTAAHHIVTTIHTIFHPPPQ